MEKIHEHIQKDDNTLWKKSIVTIRSSSRIDSQQILRNHKGHRSNSAHTKSNTEPKITFVLGVLSMRNSLLVLT